MQTYYSTKKIFFLTFITTIVFVTTGIATFLWGGKFRSVNLIKSNKVSFEIPSHLVATKVLANGMKVIAYKNSTAPSILVQVAYEVGGSAELSYERGLAHLVEHMIFKGTNNRLSESDIDTIARRYGANLNAFTTNDVTSYYFEVNKANWIPFLDIFADCMQNSRFDEQHLASELRAVVQELNMGRDNYSRQITYKAFELIFPANHPYHFPVIGFKEELANVTAKQVKDFFDKHYGPSNATLFIIGDIDPEEAIATAAPFFENIANKPLAQKPNFPPVIPKFTSGYHKIFEDVSQEQAAMVWHWPGEAAIGVEGSIIINNIIGNGEGSRLHTRLVDEEKVADSISSFCYQLLHDGLFFISFLPKEGKFERCKEIIEQELQLLSQSGFDELEINKATTCEVANFLRDLEKPHEMVWHWMHSVFCTNDPQAIFHTVDRFYAHNNQTLSALVKKYLRPEQVTTIHLLPLDPQFSQEWMATKAFIEAQENEILQKHQRTAPLEPPSFANTLPAPAPCSFSFPRPTSEPVTIHDLKVVLHQDTTTPFCHIKIGFKDAEHFSKAKIGVPLCMMMQALIEGSSRYTKQDHTDFFKFMGVYNWSFSSKGASISFLADNFDKVIERFFLILKNPTFRTDVVEKLREILIADFTHQKDSPKELARQFMKNLFFAGTDYEWDLDQGIAMLKSTSSRDLAALHAKYLNPANITLAVTGNISPDAVKHAVEKNIKGWTSISNERQAIIEPLQLTPHHELISKLRDQVIIYMTNPSDVNIYSDDRIGLSLLNKIAFESLGSRAFKLREQSGLFYSVSGGFGHNPGSKSSWNYVFTMTNPDKVKTTQEALCQVIRDVAEHGVTQAELDDAKQSVLNDFIQTIGARSAIPDLFLGIEYYGLNYDFYDQSWQKYQTITLEEVNELAKKYFNPDNFSTVMVGNFSKKK